jgi:hypothetical protein
MIPIRIGHRFTLPLDWYIRRRVERRKKKKKNKNNNGKRRRRRRRRFTVYKGEGCFTHH